MEGEFFLWQFVYLYWKRNRWKF